MSQAAPCTIAALLTHARDVPVSERERFATRLREVLTGRALIFETCHRAEGYIACADETEPATLAFLLPPGGRALVGESAVRHAIAVAVGRDSVIVGEDQILHQLRASVGEARAGSRLDPALERLFALALQTGRRARSWRQGPQRSLADAALSFIEGQTGSLRSVAVLVVGAGRMGRLAVGAAVAAGASVSIANRSAAGARALAASTGAGVELFDPGARLEAYAGVVVALSGPWPIGTAAIEALRASTTVVVDLSVPAALPDAAAVALGRRFASADDLAQADAEADPLDDGTAARHEILIDRTTADYLAWLNRRDGRAAAETLIELVERERETELASLWRRLPDLEPDAREEIERMSRHLATRLLRRPLERLGRDPDGREARAVRDLFAL